MYLNLLWTMVMFHSRLLVKTEGSIRGISGWYQVADRALEVLALLSLLQEQCFWRILGFFFGPTPEINKRTRGDVKISMEISI